MKLRIHRCLLFVLIPFVLSGATLPGAQSWPRYKFAAPLKVEFPARHPYLALTPQEIARARKRAATLPWARKQMDALLAHADRIIKNAKPWNQLPPIGSGEHRVISRNLFAVAMAYSFSGDIRYAGWVRDGLLAYAAIYPGLPMHYGYKLTYDSLRESTWAVDMARAYDLVASSNAFTAEQRRKVEDDLLRPSAKCFMITDYRHDRRLKDMHYRCYNFEAWHVAAVGLVGLATRDRDLVDWAVNSPYGLRHLIAHDINDDGMWWERSEGYHQYVLDGFVALAEPLLHCGVDVYRMEVPTDLATYGSAGERYVTDSSHRPKSIRMMFDSLFYLTFPDLSYPAVGDSTAGPLRAGALTLVGFERYHDPMLAWLIERDRPQAGATDSDRPWQWLVYDLPKDAPASFPIHDGRFANSGEFRNGCSLFPSTGIAILREAAGNYTARPGSTAVSLSYGPHGGGHGHAASLNMVLYSEGLQWVPSFGHMPYETPWKGQWTSQTVSHNTVVVDGVSQKPTGRGNASWPTDHANDRVFGVLERFNPPTKFVSAHTDTAYPGISLRRALRVEGHSVVDVFSMRDQHGARHQYDYVLHIDGRLESSSAPLEACSGKLGKICGYQFIDRQRCAVSNKGFSLTFENQGKRLRVWVPGSMQTEIILGQGLTNLPTGKMTVLVLRRSTSSTRFLTVLEPVEPGRAIRSVRMEKSGIVIDSASGTKRVPME
ncbi:MAG TPA: heparinase II/III family protein [Terriglobia bacterium]|nr:heparinase II/III family protein [Terriglobia bacterium]